MVARKDDNHPENKPVALFIPAPVPGLRRSDNVVFVKFNRFVTRFKRSAISLLSGTRQELHDVGVVEIHTTQPS